jgi:rubredoxin-NAD+ reductase
MLSTGFAKNKDADGLSMAEPGAMAEQLNAEVRTHTRISGIDPGHKRLWIGEEAVEYRDLILAWGAQTVQVPIEGDAATWYSRSTTSKTTRASVPPPPASSAC